MLGDQQRVLGGEDPDTLETRLGPGNSLGRAEEREAAIHHLRGLVDTRQRLQGPDHPETLFARDFLAHWLAKAGRFEDAVNQYRELLMDHIRIYGLNEPVKSAKTSLTGYKRRTSLTEFRLRKTAASSFSELVTTGADVSSGSSVGSNEVNRFG